MPRSSTQSLLFRLKWRQLNITNDLMKWLAHVMSATGLLNSKIPAPDLDGSSTENTDKNIFNAVTCHVTSSNPLNSQLVSKWST